MKSTVKDKKEVAQEAQILLLRAEERNWGLSSIDDWQYVTWYIYRDGSYTIVTNYSYGVTNTVTGKYSKKKFKQLQQALSMKWDKKTDGEVSGCDGVGWKLDMYAEKRKKIIKTTGEKVRYIGGGVLSGICSLLPQPDEIYISRFDAEKAKIKEEGGAVNMCNAVREIIDDSKEEGKAEGIFETRLEMIRKLKKSFKWTLEEAMEFLGIPAAERDAYYEALARSEGECAERTG